MARRSLSSQVLTVVDRVAGNLRGTLGIVDPMTAHTIGQALEGLEEIRRLCGEAQTRGAVAGGSSGPSQASAEVSAPVVKAPEKKAAPRRRATASKAVGE